MQKVKVIKICFFKKIEIKFILKKFITQTPIIRELKVSNNCLTSRELDKLIFLQINSLNFINKLRYKQDYSARIIQRYFYKYLKHRIYNLRIVIL